VVAICASRLLTAAASFASPSSTGTAQSLPAVAADQECAALLLKVEKQISDGRTATPPDDNALLTWQSVITRVEPASPGTLRALQDFEARLTYREAEEHAAGRRTVEVDLKLFEGLASELISRGAASLTNEPTAEKPAGKSDTPTRTSGPVAAPPAAISNGAAATPGAPTADRDSTSPPAAPANTPPDITLTLADPSAPLSTHAPTAMAAALVSRGDAMLAIKDISAARKLYESAADAGSAAGATALARTYDPDYLATLGVVGLEPDPAAAANWYRKAAALGDRDAETRLRTLARSAN
jgi:TPR repeat protein